MRVFLHLVIVLVACCSHRILAAEPESTPGQWKMISTSNDVVLYHRWRPGLGHYEFKAVGEIAASTAIVQAVIDDVDSYPQFMPYTVETRILKREGDSVIGYQRLSPPLVKDRDYTLRVRTTSKATAAGTSYITRWETKNDLGPAERPGILRVRLCEGGWALEPAGPNVTRATYSIYTDSGGALPGFIKDLGSQVAIRKIFAAIRKQVLEPKYQPEGDGRKMKKAN